MNHSKAHQKFSNRLQNLEAPTNPQDFLGPNYETVLNFWLYMDGLTRHQWNEVARRYRALALAARVAARDAAWNAAWDAAWDAAGADADAAATAAWRAASDAASDAARDTAGFAARDAASDATYELICMHTLLDDGKDLLFVPLFNDL
jgi:hypothetical protein